MTVRLWPGVPYLDCLRPDVGWTVDQCVVATYSANLVAVVAAMLALAGRDDDRGSGSKVDFANAHERLRGRFRVLAQKGQIAVPFRAAAVISIMDGFVREVEADEAELSWHPKIALARYTNEEQKSTEWRLWLGSKNLTRDASWDTGLLLSGTKGGEGFSLPNVGRIGEVLARYADLNAIDPAAWRRELAEVRWIGPDGIIIEDISLLGPGSKGAYPPEPAGAREVVVISPFLDGDALKHFGTWGRDGHRYLLSTVNEIARVHGHASNPLAGFAGNLLMLPPPDEDPATPKQQKEAAEDAVAVGEDEEFEGRGLHAKIIAVRDASGWVMWVGSPNATKRGWHRNYEISARVRLSDKAAEGLRAFYEAAHEVTPDVLKATPFEDLTNDEKNLEAARKRLVAHWALQQLKLNSVPIIRGTTPPPIELQGIALKVGLIGMPLVSWDRKAREVRLPPATAEQETELVQFQLLLKGYVCAWIQRVPMDPPPSEERDRRALARHLDARAFLAWIRNLLGVNGVGDGGGDWDDETEKGKGAQRDSGAAIFGWAPTLEEILKAWACEPAAVRDADRKVKRYFEYMRNSTLDERTEEERRALLEFEQVWKLVRSELITEVPK